MLTTPATGSATTRSVDAQFADLICADADLLAAEFDSIIAAEWPSPPADPPGHGAIDRRPTGPVIAGIGSAVSRPQHPGIRGRARQRSPPADAANARRRFGARVS